MMERLVNLSRLHGIVYPVECVINNTALTCYNYGPLGSLIRRNIIQHWWQSTVTSQENVFPVEDSSMGNHKKEIETRSAGDTSIEGIQHRTAFHTRTSLTAGMLDHYPSALQMVQHRLPFGLAQHGTCVKEPSSDQHFLFSSDEFEELVLQYYSPPGLASRWADHWHLQRLRWWRKLACYPSNFSSVDVDHGEEKAGTEIHIQYSFPWGPETLETISNLGPDLLLMRQNQSGISHQGKHGRKLQVPDVIQSCAVLERGLLALLLDGLTERTIPGRNSKEGQAVLGLHPCLAPYKVAVVASSSHSVAEVGEMSSDTAKQLQNAGISVLSYPGNNSSTLGVLFQKFDEMGVPLVAIINDSTLTSGILQLRSRDTTIKTKVNLLKLQDHIKQIVES